ncbi:DUF7740 domain-containing protein [Geopseudomonas aromaticivorans]
MNPHQPSIMTTPLTFDMAQLHGVALNAITVAMYTRPVRVMSFTYAITTLTLAAELHKTDKAVLNAMWTVLQHVEEQYRPLILNMMCAPSPLAHINHYLDTLPADILNKKKSQARATLVEVRPAPDAMSEAA